MRLMLGVNDEPSLLVDVKENIDRNEFDFYVVNGDWHGKFDNGSITVFTEGLSKTNPIYDGYEILCDNQMRLRDNYQTVFANFHDEDFKSPMFPLTEDDWDELDNYEDEHTWMDDIPF